MTHSRTPRTAIAALLIATSTTANAAWGMLAVGGTTTYVRNPTLHDAAAANSIVDVKYLLCQRTPANQRDVLGKTPLDYASQSGHLVIAQLLVQYDPTIVRQHDSCGKTALHQAAEHNQAQVIRLLAECDSSLIDLPDKQGKTPLHLACTAGHVKPTRELLALGANPDRQDAAGDNAWTHAARGPEKTWRKVVAALKAAEERRRDQRAAITQALDEPEWRDILKILHTYADCDQR
ncbi:MAG: ankyrin repeat domain-containing protein [Myxococcota bacterium]